MALESLAVVGATFAGKPGFVLLADNAELAAGGHAEDLQDHDCVAARKAR
jgi:CDP-diacylglycerol pyrophosphatase